MVQQVVGQRGGGATVGAAGNVAPVVVAAAVHLPGFARTGRAGGIHAGQSMRHAATAATVEILFLGTASVERSLPELPEMRVDEGVAVAGSAQAVGERGAATGAIARSWLAA